MHPDDDQQGDVERWSLIERFIETAEQVEQETGRTACRWLVEDCGQRENDEAADCDDLCRQIALCQPVDLDRGVIEEKRKTVEQIDRPVGEDRPCHEGDRMFPGEGHVGNICSLRGKPVGCTIGDVEQWCEQEQPKDGALRHSLVETPCPRWVRWFLLS